MSMNEQETRFALIDPELRKKGWNIEAKTLRLEKTLGANIFNDKGEPCKLSGRADYLLCLKLNDNAQPLPIAFIEAKKETLSVSNGLEQAINYARAHYVPFVFSTNGHLFIKHDIKTNTTTEPFKMSNFPSHQALLEEYNQTHFLTSKYHDVLIASYKNNKDKKISNLRYYQEAAIRAVINKIMDCENKSSPKRVLLSLATGTGKTKLATHLLNRINETGLLDKALFVCDRDELRSQAYDAFNQLFGSNTQMVTNENPQKNAKVLIATYQTLGVDNQTDNNEEKISFLMRHYPENYFSHIIIDECHRSGFGKWSAVLSRNSNAVHIGLTATPRQLKNNDADSKEDHQISADNYTYFGEPVYEYDLLQATNDGYLSVCNIIQRHVLIDGINEKEGLKINELDNLEIKNYFNNQEIDKDTLKKIYAASELDSKVMLPERTALICNDLFSLLSQNNEPTQKTIIFCAGVDHAQNVAIELRNIYSRWCTNNGFQQKSDFAFPCTGTIGRDNLSEFKKSRNSHFIACTADLLQAGVDVPWVINIVFFTYINSAIRFYQMVGRGTRLHDVSQKISFKLYDYTNASRLFGEEFLSTISTPQQNKPKNDLIENNEHTKESEKIIPQITNIPISIEKGKTSFLIIKEGKHITVSLEEYLEKLKELIVEKLPTFSDFTKAWVETPDKIIHYPEVEMLLNNQQSNFDSFDILAEMLYQQTPYTKLERTNYYLKRNQALFDTMPKISANTLRALANIFKLSGTQGIISKELFNTQQIKEVCGGNPIQALRKIGEPKQVFLDFKRSIFSN